MGFTLGGLAEIDDPQVRLLLAVDAEGTVQAVTSWPPVHADTQIVGRTLDFMRRRADSPAGIMEFLIATAALDVQAEGGQFLSLSRAPLARADSDAPVGGVQRLLDLVARRLEPVYGFRSLLAFKAKFQPVYRPLHLAYPDPVALPAIGAALTRAYLPDLTPRELKIDRAVAAHARAALDAAGLPEVVVVIADGELGWADGSAYDRVIATAGAIVVPYTWVAQTVPGGRLVVPISNAFHPPGLAVFDVDPAGIAEGRLAGSAAFMGLRGQRQPRPDGADRVRDAPAVSSTHLHPYRWAGDAAAAAAIGQYLGRGGDRIHKHYARADTPGSIGTQWLLHPPTRSWATVELADRPPYEVCQAGPRPLHDEVIAAYQRWLDAGRPEPSDWVLTVGPAGQEIAIRTAADRPITSPVRHRRLRQQYADRRQRSPTRHGAGGRRAEPARRLRGRRQ